MTLSATMIGRVAQTTLEKWAAQVGITANPPLHDERGWDVLLQLPGTMPTPAQGPLDKVPPEVSCMVQIKATTTDDTFEPINLANWRRMCTEPIPWFVLAMHIDSTTMEPTRAYLVHVDQHWCEKVLRRLRELSAEGKEAPHHHTLNVTWGEVNQLRELHGRELLRLIRHHIAPDQRRYVAAKLPWFDNLGYMDRSRRIMVSYRGPDEDTVFEQLADLGAGLRSTFPAEWRARVSDVRFGLEAKLSEFGAEAGEMEYKVPAQGRVRLEIAGARSGRHVALDCDVYRASAVFPFLPPRHDKIRLGSADTSIVLSPIVDGPRRGFSSRFQFALPNDPVSIEVLRQAVDLAYLLTHHGEDPLKVRLVGPSGASDISPEDVGGADHTEGLRDLVTTLDAALAVCKVFDVPESVVVRHEQFEEQAPAARFMAGVIERTEGELVAPYKGAVDTGQMFGATTEVALHLPDRMLACVAGFYGNVSGCDVVSGLGARIRVDHGAKILEKSSCSTTRKILGELWMRLAREFIRS
jgi:hypothetical protein